MRWHPLATDKTFLQLKGFDKIPTDNRDIGQRSDGTGGTNGTNHQLEPMRISNQSIFYLKKAIMEK